MSTVTGKPKKQSIQLSLVTKAFLAKIKSFKDHVISNDIMDPYYINVTLDSIIKEIQTEYSTPDDPLFAPLTEFIPSLCNSISNIKSCEDISRSILSVCMPSIILYALMCKLYDQYSPNTEYHLNTSFDTDDPMNNIKIEVSLRLCLAFMKLADYNTYEGFINNPVISVYIEWKTLIYLDEESYRKIMLKYKLLLEFVGHDILNNLSGAVASPTVLTRPAYAFVRHLILDMRIVRLESVDGHIYTSFMKDIIMSSILYLDSEVVEAANIPANDLNLFYRFANSYIQD
jgi:hypothetical protein